MGRLLKGATLDWSDIERIKTPVRENGIKQLLKLWQKNKGRENDPWLWGDEIEGIMVSFDDAVGQVKPCSRARDVLESLAAKAAFGGNQEDAFSSRPFFCHEAGSFNLEVVPGKPSGLTSADVFNVEANMKWRCSLVEETLGANEHFLTMTSFPRLGAEKDPEPVQNPSSSDLQRSQYLPDAVISPTTKHHAVVANIRSRRRRKVAINVPIYRDTKTPWPFQDLTVNYDLHRWPEDDEVRNGAVKENTIYMDSSMFGSSCCSLQVTMQAPNIAKARKLYDQLLPLGPIMLALTAATPIWKGFLADTDVRWNAYSASADDRTPEELGEEPLSGSSQWIQKPRFASNSTYISEDPRLLEEYQDPKLTIDHEVEQRLLAGGMDARLAAHFAHLYIRDPLIIYAKDVETFDTEDTTHFELIQSTNWQTLRFKPPPSMSSGDTGWRVEFRPMEVQMTDYENAAFVIFMVLLSRTILQLDLNFYIPIAKVDENMERAHVRDAVLREKFHFRKHPLQDSHVAASTQECPSNENTLKEATPEEFSSTGTSSEHGSVYLSSKSEGSSNSAITDGSAVSREAPEHPPPQVLLLQTNPNATGYDSLSIDQIINGRCASNDDFPGLIPLVRKYVDTTDLNAKARAKINTYLDFIGRRASGALCTSAKWQRKFVRSHSEYKEDSVVGEKIVYDLLKAVKDITESNGEAAVGRAMFKF